MSEPSLQPSAEFPHEVFVGRAEQVRALGRILRATAPGRPGPVVVTGPEGIGKTALAERLAAGLPGAPVLRACGAESEAALPYGLIEQLLGRGDAGAVDPRRAGALLLDRILRLDRAGTDGTRTGGRADPIIMIVDNVQWGDRESLQAILYALRRLPDTRLAAIMIAPADAAEQIPAEIRRFFAAAGAVRAPVPGLDTAAVAELYERLTGRWPSRRAAGRLREHTQGNPLHIRSLLDQIPAGALEDPGVPLPVPASLAGPVLAALARCGTPAAELVGAAAVLGERCRLESAAQVAGTAEPLHALERAIADGLLVEEFGTGHIRFPCPMIHMAVYRTHLGPAQRRALHERAAASAADPGTRLWHRGRGAIGPDRELAAELARLGRDRAASGRWVEAGRRLAEAAELSGDPAERARLVLEAAEASVINGTDDLEALTGRVRALPASAWRAYVLGALALNAGRVAEAESLFDDARSATGPDGTAPDGPGVAARVAGQMALLRVMQTDVPSAVRWSGRALRRAASPAPVELARYLSAYALWRAGREAEALDVPSRAPALAAATAADLDALLARARLRIWQDDPDGAADDLDGVLGTADPPPVRSRLIAYLMRAEIEYIRGRWDAALAACDAADAVARDAGHVLLVPFIQIGRVPVLAARGDWDAAEQCLGTAAGLAASGLVREHAAAAAARLAAARGDHDAVIAALRPDIDAGSGASVGLLVAALAAAGRTEEAETVLAALEARAGNHCSALAAAARARGYLHAARREPERAASAFERALSLLAGLSAPFERALIELEHGTFLRRAGRRNQAAGHLERAAAALGPLGARPYLDRCERELAACGRRGHAGTFGLTARELAVAQQAARGLTNRQIARELLVSVKTVEYHLSHVYPKLQIRSRAELALRLAGP